MLITSSRKPSASTRILCKYMAAFFGCEYFNRGKMSMSGVLDLSHGSLLMILGEHHGNPGSITVYDSDGFCVLSAHVSLLPLERKTYSISKNLKPEIVGRGEFASAFSDIFSLPLVEVPSSQLRIKISKGQMDFVNNDIVFFSLKLRTYRLYEGDVDCN
jgi:U3 small nucleolar ribonucleoprotein protein IMP4